MTLSLYAWLVKLSTNKNFRRWLVTVGPVATKAFANFLVHMRNRESGIRQAHEIDGQFSVATIKGKRHVIVWKDGRPFSAWPEVEGNLEEELEHYNRTLLKNPDDLARRKAQRLVNRRTGASTRPSNSDPAEAPLPKELPAKPDRE